MKPLRLRKAAAKNRTIGLHVKRRAGGEPPSLQLLERAERDAPLNPAVQRALSTAYASAGDPVKAAAAGIAAAALATHAPLQLYNLATGYLMHGQPLAAEKWYRAALALDPELAIAHQNLSAILRADGRHDEARRHRELAYATQWVFSDAPANPSATVLLPCAGGIGNVPFEHLLPAQRYGRVKCMVDYAPADMSAALVDTPRHDVVFNAIGDPDVIAADDPRLLRVLGFSSRPILNPPHAVARTRRDRLPVLLQGIAHTVVPPVWRIVLQAAGATALADALERKGSRYPLILRPAASHGGAEVVLATCRRTVEESALLSKPPGDAEVAYATAYHEYRSADGYYRKYRMIFVDGRPYPYHLAISPDWLVHYFSADMQEPWKLEEERRFLEDPEQAIGAEALRAITVIGQRLGLDYAGVDFSILENGDVLVFEANATMLVHPERQNGPFAYKNRAVTAITNAFQRMIVRAAAIDSP